jgi:hypothetical protein
MYIASIGIRPIASSVVAGFLAGRLRCDRQMGCAPTEYLSLESALCTAQHRQLGEQWSVNYMKVSQISEIGETGSRSRGKKQKAEGTNESMVAHLISLFHRKYCIQEDQAKESSSSLMFSSVSV